MRRLARKTDQSRVFYGTVFDEEIGVGSVMRNISHRIIVSAIAFLVAPLSGRAVASDHDVLALSPSATAGIGGGRFGAALEWSALTCVDACSGFGLSIGATDFSREEYTVGIGGIFLYMGSFLLQADVRVKDGEAVGFHITPGFGALSAFAILRLGYDQRSKLAVAEVGVTVKIPVLGWD